MIPNDPFVAPPAALGREAGHQVARAKAKWAVLTQPVGATGVPLGGLGTGSIMRASDGRFSRWTIKAGGIRTFDMPVSGFVLRVASGDGAETRALQPQPADDELAAFAFEPAPPAWEGLFPLAWHRHAAVRGVAAECLSFSPFIPGDTAEASLPLAVFRWRLTNTGDTPAEASLAFTFPNLNGWFRDFGDGRLDRPQPGAFNHAADFDEGACVLLDRRRVAEEPNPGDGQWSISVTAGPDAVHSRTVCFNGSGDGADFWDAFAATGDAPDLGEGWLVEGGFREVPPDMPAAAVAARRTVPPGETREMTFALVWDLPVIEFGQGRRWYRAYTDNWGRTGHAGVPLARLAHGQADDWQRRIGEWHEQVVAELGEEPWRAGTAINEAYFLVEGLSVYTSAHGTPDGRSHFALIECHDYALYNTLDLWIYAAESVGRLFPELAANVAADYAAHVATADPALRRHRYSGELFVSNPAGSCPHDLGGPGEDPFVVPNSYTHRNATVWKDLNCDFVLCVWREGQAAGVAWRNALFPDVKAAIDHLQRFDTDGDGLIENDGSPDQTFDNIPMRGPSSYCGGLWIAALRAGARMAEEAGEPAVAEAWSAQAESAAEAYNRLLYDGTRFRIDTDGPLTGACFIEQLLGPFMARRLGLGDIVPEAHAVSALRDVYRLNFVEEGRGEGAVSLAAVPEAARALLPHQADTEFQTAEIQPGFNFSLAAQFESWGLWDEADALRQALHRQLHVERNLVFQTPAALYTGRNVCRAILNMRPLAVWWMAPRPG